MDFFREALAGGPRLVEEVQKEATAAGIRAHTLRRARERLHIQKRRTVEPRGPFEWFLPASTEEKEIKAEEATLPSQNMVKVDKVDKVAEEAIPGAKSTLSTLTTLSNISEGKVASAATPPSPGRSP